MASGEWGSGSRGLSKLTWALKIGITYITAVLFICSCTERKAADHPVLSEKLPEQFVAVLGIAQDAGYPQTGCNKACCKAYWSGGEQKKRVTSLALVDRSTRQYWLFDATPDVGDQLVAIKGIMGSDSIFLPAGIFITHAHTGHYTGLLQLGREVMGATQVPVYAMPRLDSFLRWNGPWSQLIQLQNISLRNLQADSSVSISPALRVTPFRVPHRDEFSETVGFWIESNRKKILFIPDIDKWEKWDRDINEQVIKSDGALLDGTFYANGELPGRDMKEIPHPFVEESLQRFSALSSEDRSKIIFIHFNHTNPLLKKKAAEKHKVVTQGYKVGEEGMIIAL